MSAFLSHCLRQRQCNKYNTSRSNTFNKFSRQVYGDPFFLNRMVLDKSLKSPTNVSISSLCWSAQGDSLISGSRSGQLCLWNPLDDALSLSTTITTDERSCIHTANYISNDRVICGSETGTICIYDLNTGKSIDSYSCSKSSTRIEINDNCQDEVISCSEDGIIRHFDLRQNHVCDRSAQCSCVLFDLNSNHQLMSSIDPIRLQSVSINPLVPSYLAVAGSQNYAYLHDRRMISTKPVGQSLVKLFANKNGINGATQNELCYSNACKFSKTHSDTLMINWSDDDIYLFNIYDEPTAATTLSQFGNEMDVDAVQYRYRYTGHLNPWVNGECIGFYGLDDEYIISGTDDGMVFIWNTRNEKVVQMFSVNQSPVNAVKGHPYLPMMAIADSDSSIKLYTPRSEPLMTSPATHPFAETSYSTTSHMFEVDSLIERNEQLKHGHPSHLFDYLIQNDSGPPPCYLQ
ncbi:unnamed protein product [Absidia cylindrospora]